ncbi:MAG: hypothetical protein MJ252_07670 [archaeon]|nr:hypothetical protein [archaeon]
MKGKHSSRAKSAKPTSKKVHNNLTPDEIYNMSNRIIPWGIEGYEIPRQYFDYHQVIWQRERADRLSGKVKAPWPPKDWPKAKDDDTRQVEPKKFTYLDELDKWCHSFYDKERAQELIDKGIDVNDYVKPNPIDKEKRTKFLANEKKKEEWKKQRDEFIPDYKQNGIDDIKARIIEHDKQRAIPYSERMKAKYGKGKEQFPRCDRVTVVADAEFVGEQIPFYNTPKVEGDAAKSQKLFWPNKFVTMKRYPAWKIYKPTPRPETANVKDQMMKEKIENYLNDKNLKEDDLNLQIRQTFYNVTHHGKVYMTIHKPSDWKNEPHHQSAEEQNKYGHPGPDYYWRMPKETYGKKVELGTIEDANGNKIYYMDRRKTDKRVYKSGMRKAVY